MNSARKHFAEGLRLRETRRWKAAIRAFEAAVAADPGSADAWYWLAVTRDNRGEEEDAIPAYREAIRLGLSAERLGRAWTWLASSLSKSGRPAEALECLAEAAAVGGYQPPAEYARIRDNVQRRAQRDMRSKSDTVGSGRATP